jgi:hypothetical protein
MLPTTLRSIALLCFAAAIDFVPLWALAQRINDPPHGIAFAVPAGYHDFPEGHSAPTILHAFSRGLRGQPAFTVCSIQAMDGTIAHAPLNAAMLDLNTGTSGGGVSTWTSSWRTLPTARSDWSY